MDVVAVSKNISVLCYQNRRILESLKLTAQPILQIRKPDHKMFTAKRGPRWQRHRRMLKSLSPTGNSNTPRYRQLLQRVN